MNTAYTPVDPDFLYSLALSKAHGQSWAHIAEKYKVPVLELEIIPWREPQTWAKACRYAEKLVAHEILAETLANLRQDLRTTDVRLKTQVANSTVRLIELQQQLRRPKRLSNSERGTRNAERKNQAVPTRPVTEPLVVTAPERHVVEPLVVPVPEAPKAGPRSPVGNVGNTLPQTVVAVLLFVLLGTFTLIRVAVFMSEHGERPNADRKTGHEPLCHMTVLCPGNHTDPLCHADPHVPRCLLPQSSSESFALYRTGIPRHGALSDEVTDNLNDS